MPERGWAYYTYGGEKKTFRFIYRLPRILEVLEDFEGVDGYMLNILYDSAALTYYKCVCMRTWVGAVEGGDRHRLATSNPIPYSKRS